MADLLRKERKMQLGPFGVTVSMPPELADRVRGNSVYRKVVRPAVDRLAGGKRASGGDPGGATDAVVAPTVPTLPDPSSLDAEGRAILDRIKDREWYHSIDLGHGVVTPGLVDHRAQLPYYGMPDSMAGLRVLDIATFDGFWAFEFERRGATVVATDIPRWSDVDLPRRMVPHAATLGLDRVTGDEFAIAHDILGSKVERVLCSVYDLDPDVIGTFDLVFISDVLLHLRCPQAAIEHAASVCHGDLVIADVFTPMLEGFGDLPLAQLTAPSQTWWLPNVKALQTMMLVAGCDPIDEVSRFVLDWAIDDPMHKVVLRGHVPQQPGWLGQAREFAATPGELDAHRAATVPA